MSELPKAELYTVSYEAISIEGVEIANIEQGQNIKDFIETTAETQDRLANSNLVLRLGGAAFIGGMVTAGGAIVGERINQTAGLVTEVGATAIGLGIVVYGVRVGKKSYERFTNNARAVRGLFADIQPLTQREETAVL